MLITLRVTQTHTFTNIPHNNRVYAIRREDLLLSTYGFCDKNHGLRQPGGATPPQQRVLYAGHPHTHITPAERPNSCLWRYGVEGKHYRLLLHLES